MSNEELDALDRVCLLAMGCHPVSDESGIWTHWPGLIPEARIETPSPTRSWSDFGALLLWLEKNGHYPFLFFTHWYGSGRNAVAVWQGQIDVPMAPATIGTSRAEDADPRVALCMAVAEWAKKDGAK